ncbi:hypothetical protein DL93DRAFT_2088872 [Clavulina sp. PMI_390]|nr:hypothetical protein DL93DRAFT_2088872 [Clavulina sp. PMI_390]
MGPFSSIHASFLLLLHKPLILNPTITICWLVHFLNGSPIAVFHHIKHFQASEP